MHAWEYDCKYYFKLENSMLIWMFKGQKIGKHTDVMCNKEMQWKDRIFKQMQMLTRNMLLPLDV